MNLINYWHRWRALWRISSGQHYLQQTGWLASTATGHSVLPDGTPLPWLVYPCISFIKPRLSKDMTVFEYGSGYGTLWWAQRVQFVEAVEDNPAWVAKVQPHCPDNATIHHINQQAGSYPLSAQQGQHAPYDIIIIDGPRRKACLEQCLPALKENGVILLDDSERPEYRSATKKLVRDHGFKRLDFVGLAPIFANVKQTSIFYKTDNVLGI